VVQALGIVVRIVFLNETNLTELTFPRTVGEEEDPQAWVLLKPGHYDVLYPNKTSDSDISYRKR
jgi:hypothetical protein